MLETDYHRQLDILPPDRAGLPITLIGAGGIGSLTAFALAKMGMVNITAWDDDEVERENVPPQLFHLGQVGQPKVAALKDTIQAFTDHAIQARPELWDGETTGQVVIGAVDNMAARQSIFDSLQHRYGVELYIDARMGGETMRLFCFKPTEAAQAAEYAKTLYSDTEAVPEACTARAIAYNTFAIGGLIASIVKKYAMGQPYPNELIFDLRTYDLYAGRTQGS